MVLLCSKLDDAQYINQGSLIVLLKLYDKIPLRHQNQRRITGIFQYVKLRQSHSNGPK